MALAFRVDASIAVVCDHCRAVVVRGDVGPEQIGKLGTFLPHPSPLTLWGEGTLGGVKFQLTGHAQLDHAAGGTWDEWYARLDDGRWAWIAEAQGQRWVTFEVPPEQAGALPRVEDLRPGGPAMPGFVVGEIGQGTYRAAEGELPFRLEPGRAYTFADLSAPNGFVATIDYGVAGAGEPPTLYRGKSITLAELGLADAPIVERAAPSVKSRRLACPECDGNLDFVAGEAREALPSEGRSPLLDAMERVICPYCSSKLDVNEGALRVVKALKKRLPEPPIPLGAQGVFDGETYTVAGWMERSVTNPWGRFPWDELLLHAPKTGFRWLTRTRTGHWSFVEPVAGGDVEERGYDVRHDGTTYRRFDVGKAVVDVVVGAFPWRVERGEQAQITDYIAPPYALSSEVSATEQVWSRSTWMTPEEIKQAFGDTFADKRPPGPATGVAPNQPWRHARAFRYGAVLCGVMLLLIVAFAATIHTRSVGKMEVALARADSETATQVWYSEPLELTAGKNLHVELTNLVQNGWLFIAGDFFDEETGDTIGFEQPLEYYSGVEGGESWSEGAQRVDAWLTAPPTGLYTLRLEIMQAPSNPASTLYVSVEQGVFRAGAAFGLLVALALPMVIAWFARRKFEATRWEDSSLPNPYASSSGDDD